MINKSNISYIKAPYVSVGCYPASSSTYWNDIFEESGISSSECSLAISNLTGLECYANAYQWIYSNTSLTVEICLKICITHGFNYTGLDT